MWKHDYINHKIQKSIKTFNNFKDKFFDYFNLVYVFHNLQRKHTYNL